MEHLATRGRGIAMAEQPYRRQDHHAARVAAALAGRARRALRLRRRASSQGSRAAQLAPSLAPLIKITRALGVRLGTLLDDDTQVGPVVTRKDARRGGRAPQVARDLERRRRARLLLAGRGQDLAPHGAVHDHREPGRRREPLALEPRGRGVRLRARRRDRDRVRQGPARARRRATASTTTRSCRTSCAPTATSPARILAVVYAPA